MSGPDPVADVLQFGSVASPDALAAELDADGYLTDDGLATAVFLALRLGRPLLLEGEAGVGKTEIAYALARRANAPLIRLQCYEGIDASQALYDWDHARQLLHLRAREASGAESDPEALEAGLYDERYLRRRPLLEAITTHGVPPVLLIDELDRADEEFEALLLEVLSNWTISIPELGTVRATVRPVVILTSNRTRELHDALKRRCLYHWIDHPDASRELEIVLRRAPAVRREVAEGIAALVAHLRSMPLLKTPGIAETIEWARAIEELGGQLDASAARRTLGAVLKHRDDLGAVGSAMPSLMAAIGR